MARRPNSIEQNVEALVLAILQDALNGDTPLPLRLEALKAINPFYSTQVRAKKGEEEIGQESFTAFRELVKQE